MTKYILLIFTILASTVLAQTTIYHPFPDSNGVWNEEGARIVGGLTTKAHWQQRFFINGDTTINATYHKIYCKRIEELTSIVSFCSNEIPGIPVLSYFGAIRQDTIDRKVYFLSPGSTNDTLLYDFNLSIGDTLPPSWRNQIAMIVTHIDSIFDGTGYRKYFSLSDAVHYDSLAIIEGIGSTRGLFYWLNEQYQASNELRCLKQDSLILYSDACPYACDMATNLNDISEKRYIASISPNPLHSTASLKLNFDFGKAILRVYDTIGNLVWNQEITYPTTEIQRGQQKNGIYFFCITNEAGQVVTKKILIE